MTAPRPRRARAARAQPARRSADARAGWPRRWMWIAWPAFLMAGVLEMIVFALVDPAALHWSEQPVAVSREGVYTIAFFVFWCVIMAAGALTTLLSLSPFEMNRCPVPRGERPADCAKYR